MADDPFRTHSRAAARLPADHPSSDDRDPEPLDATSNSAPIIHPPDEAAAWSSAQFGAGREESGRVFSRWPANWMRRGLRIWRRHLNRDQLPAATGRSAGNIERWLLALLSVLVIVSCVCAAIVFTQVKSLKAETATLQREIIALKLHVARLDQIASANEAARDKPSSEAPKPQAETRPDQASLALSREEMQLIRDYIKPAPIAGAAIEPIKVGDPVTGETIPFPSPITEKVPKLLGARFTIRNGIIVITRNGSNRADAVIGPN
jgi:hypothetical protein